MTIQETLCAFLASHGEHAKAQEALATTNRLDWVRLTDDAIRSAPEWNRTGVALNLKLALDDPKNDGPGVARDFEMRPEAHKSQPGVTMYRAYMHNPAGHWIDVELASHDTELLKRRIVGMYVARNIAVKE